MFIVIEVAVAGDNKIVKHHERVLSTIKHNTTTIRNKYSLNDVAQFAG